MDRNTEKWPYSDFHNLSLSARRAWIEMVIDFPLDKFDAVALRKESVDRNMRWVAARINTIASLSARRAWIEIRSIVYNSASGWVALRKESVDRNAKWFCNTLEHLRRSPQGERG